MKPPKIIARPYKNSLSHKFVVDLRAYGKGRLFFKSKDEAEAEATRQRNLLKRHGDEAIGMSSREMSEIIHARKTLAKHGETLADALKFRIDFLERVKRSGVTVATLADEVLDAKQRDGMSKAYLVDLKVRFKRFCADFGNRAISGITVEEIDDWLRDLEGSPVSRANYRRNVGVLFGYATKRRIIDHNPILHTAKPKLPDNPPEIWSVDDLRSLLESAQRTEPSVVPMLAIGAFAGLRDAEIKRLDWSEVDLTRGFIEVTAAKAKSARRRIVAIQPNLAEWLRPFSGRTGKVAPHDSLKRIDTAFDAANLSHWPKNGLRHSLASYRYAATNDAALVASGLGHTTTAMLFNTYRELVTPEEATRYFAIAPAAAAANVVAFAS